MSWMARRLEDFGELWPAEAKIVAEMGSGAPVVISDTVPPTDAPHELRLRASFVRYLALGGCEDCRPSEKGIRIVGAFIHGDGPKGAETPGLDLERCSLLGDVTFFGCFFPDRILLRGAELGGLHLDGSRLADGLSADRLEARGGVYLRRVDAKGEVRLVAAKLGSNLECDGAVFRAKTAAAGKPGVAFAADGLEAKGSVHLMKVDAIGEVRLLGAKLGGDVGCIGATLWAKSDREGDWGIALQADGLEAKGTLFLKGGSRIEGVLSLVGAEVGALSDSSDSWPAPGRLILDRFRYGAITDAPVDAASRLKWLALQDPARWRHDFWPQPYVQCAQVLREMGHEADARAILIEKERRQRQSVRDGVRARLRGARLRRRIEREGLEPVHGAISRTVKSWSDNDPRRAIVLAELEKAPAFRAFLRQSEKKQAEPQLLDPPPSDPDAHAAQLGSVMHSPDADERAVAALSPILDYRLRLIGLTVWDGLIGAVIGYGRRPQVAGLWALGFFLLGWFVFAWAAGNGGIKPGQPVTLRGEAWVECRAGADQARVGESQLACFQRQPEAHGYPDFNAFIYSADTLLPIVDLEMQRFWLPDEKTWPGSTARVYLWVHIVVGWALSLLAVAGFSGLVKSD